MTGTPNPTELDELVVAARAASPQPFSIERTRELAARAVAAAEARRVERRRRIIAGFVAVAAMVGVVASRTAFDVGSEETLAVVETRAGDRLERTLETRFEVVLDQETNRRVELGSGTVLCDVRPLGPGSSFEVDAGETRVHVRGTVFSVTREDATVVRVYEGRVEVAHGGDVIEVLAGEQWSSRTRGVARLSPGPLDERGRSAAEQRAEAAAPPTEIIAVADDAGAAEDRSAPEAPVAELPSDASVANVAPDSPPGQDQDVVARPLPTVRDEPARPSPRTADTAIREGRASEALALAREGIARGESGWGAVHADALRALGRPAEAADAYDAAARRERTHRAELAYSAAILRSRTLHDDAGALRSLDAGNVGASALAERGLVLRVHLLRSLGRTDEARSEARRYLERFGDRGSAAAMQGFLGE